MTSITVKPGLLGLYNELQAAGDVTRLAFDGRGRPTSEARTGAELFAKAGMGPLYIQTTAGIGDLVALLKGELDQGTLRLEKFDIGLAAEPYHLRDRFGVLLAALKRSVETGMQGIELRRAISADTAAEIRADVANKGIDGDTFQVAASSAYLDMLRLRKYAEADALASAFPARDDAGAAVFDVSQVAQRVILEALEDGKFAALESLGDSSGRADAVRDLLALEARGHMPRKVLLEEVAKHVVSGARFGEKVDPAFQPLMNDAIRAALRAARTESARQDLSGLARGFVRSTGSFGPGNLEQTIAGLKGQLAGLSAMADEGLIGKQEIADATRSAYLQSLAERGKNGPASVALAAEPANADIAQADIDEALTHYARKLLEQTPDAEWVARVADHAEYIAGGVEPVIRAAAYRAENGMYRAEPLLEAIEARFPTLDLAKPVVNLPPTYVKGLDLRAALAAELTSPEARALGNVFCDWWGGSLGWSSSDHDPIGPAYKINEMREACAQVLAYPEVVPGPGEGLLAAINEQLIREGSMKRSDLTEREERDRKLKDRLGGRIREALGGTLEEVPYAGLLELQSALARINDQLEARATKGPKYEETFDEARLFAEAFAAEKEAPSADLQRVYNGIRYVSDAVAKTERVTMPVGLSLSHENGVLLVRDSHGGRFSTDWTTQHARDDKGTAGVFVTTTVRGGKVGFMAAQVVRSEGKPRLVNVIEASSMQTLLDTVFEQTVLPGDFAKRTTAIRVNAGHEILANGPARNGELELTSDKIGCRIFLDPATGKVRFPEGSHSNWVDPQIVSGSVAEGKLVVSSFDNYWARKPGDPRERTTLTFTASKLPDRTYTVSSVRE